jgi:glyoxylase-like metal-dependent hydrolase (beta-lactamase superfamily II)
MLFKQLIEADSCTYTYLLACQETGEAILIDPVIVDDGTQKLLFSGDALLIEACGHTDFQSGDPQALYSSITEKFFTLADETLVYPGHDYEGRQISTIGQEKQRNPRLSGKTEAYRYC